MTADPGPPAVRLADVSKSFGAMVAVDHLDLTIERGEFFSIIGPSGCGKTTTLRMIAGFEDPTNGTVHVGGCDVTRARPYHRAVNTVFQSYALFPHLNVFENVAFGLREAKRPKAEISQRVAEAIRLVHLDGRELARPRELSGGQQQRVALARAIVNRPEVLLLDEPLGALDLKLRAELQSQLKDLHRVVGITFCYVTHDQGEAFSMSDRVAVMRSGVLDQVGTPEDVYRHPSTAFVADFVGAANRLPGRVVRAEPQGRYQVKIDGIGKRLVRGPARLEPGTDVLVVVRPEDLRLDGPPSAGGLPVTAVVEDVAFLGAHRTVRLGRSPVGPLIATTTGGGSRRRGDRVMADWADDDAWAVPSPAPAG